MVILRRKFVVKVVSDFTNEMLIYRFCPDWPLKKFSSISLQFLTYQTRVEVTTSWWIACPQNEMSKRPKEHSSIYGTSPHRKGITQRDPILGTALGFSVAMRLEARKSMYQLPKPPPAFDRACVDLWRVSIFF